jgi:SAM-dependent methyltransferase
MSDAFGNVTTGDVPFTRERLLRLAQLDRWHFWFGPRRALVMRLVERYMPASAGPVLDVGCGSGLMLEELGSCRYRAVGLDLLPEGLMATREAHPETPLVRADAARLPFLERTLSGVLLLDLLEHVDDQEVLAQAYRILRPGGVLLLTAPAVPWLWSYRDKAAGHRRRYSRRGLEQALNRSGLVLEEMRYYQCFLFPLVVMTRLMGRRGPRARDLEERPNRLLNALLMAINGIEVRLGEFVSWPVGSSLVAVCRRE